MIVWSPTPLSASSVIRLCRESWSRPCTLARSLTYLQAVFKVVTGRVGSRCLTCQTETNTSPVRFDQIVAGSNSAICGDRQGWVSEGVVGAKAAITVPYSVCSDLRSEPQNR